MKIFICCLVFLGVSLVFAKEKCQESCRDLSRYTFTIGKEKLPDCDFSHCFDDCGRDLNTHTSYSNVEKYIKEIHQACPSISWSYVIGTSEKGKNLSVLVLSDNPDVHEVGEPEFKYVANMHGNEVVGKEVLLNFAYCLCHEYESNDDYNYAVKNIRMHFLFSMNPDGYEMADQVDWLKGRSNANDVDLNRNFPDLDSIAFELEDAFENGEVRYCKTDHLDELKHNFGAKLRNAQSETQAIAYWLDKFPFVLSANLHGGSFVANYPYDTSENGKQVVSRAPDNKVFEKLAETYATTHTFMSDSENVIMCPGDTSCFSGGTTNGAKWYPVAGGMQDFNYLYSNDFEITLELGCVKYPRAEDMWLYHWQNKDALYEFMMWSLKGIKGVVRRSNGHPIENAAITVSPVGDSSSELRCHSVTSAQDGDFWRILTPGKYDVTITKKGFKPSMIERVFVSNQEATNLGEIFLTPV